MKKFFDINLRTKLLFTVLLSSIIPLLLLGFFSYKYISDIMQEDLSHHELNNLTNLNKQLHYFLSDIDQLSFFFYKNKDIHQIISKSDDRTSEEKHEDSILVKDIIKTATGVKNWDVDIYILGQNGDKYFTTNFLPPEYNNIRDNWGIFRKMNEADGEISWDINYSVRKLDKKEIVLTAGRLLKDTDTSEPIGYIMIDINERAFSNIYEEQFNSDDTFFALDEQGYVVSSFPDKNDVGTKLETDFIDRIFNNKQGFFKYNHLDSPAIVTYHSSDETKLKLVSIKNLTAIQDKNSLIRKLTFNFALIGIIVSIWLTYFLSKTITMPLYKLMFLMGEVEQGNLEVRFKSKYQDDIGVFGKQFNNMLKQLEILIEESYEKQIRLKESEIKALQAQINPHFLYNTLDTVNWLARLKGVNEISDIVVSLSEIMKYSIKEDKDLVTIEEDMNQLSNYLTIQEFRFADKFNVTVDVENKIKHELIPPLLIQPLVENSIIHGLEPKVEAGIILISIRIIENQIEIKVQDDGVGMSEEAIALANDQINDSTKFHIGLNNVRKRLKLFYGANHTWSLHSNLGTGTTITIKIPYKEGHKDV